MIESSFSINNLNIRKNDQIDYNLQKLVLFWTFKKIGSNETNFTKITPIKYLSLHK